MISPRAQGITLQGSQFFSFFIYQILNSVPLQIVFINERGKLAYIVKKAIYSSQSSDTFQNYLFKIKKKKKGSCFQVLDYFQNSKRLDCYTLKINDGLEDQQYLHYNVHGLGFQQDCLRHRPLRAAQEQTPE